MINFSDDLFPSDIAYGMSGGPEFSTDVVTLSNGKEQRNSNWLHPRNKYNVGQGVKTAEQLQRLISFFRTKRGKAIAFRFKDWTDFSVQKQIIAYADGQSDKFQLVKTYESAGEKVTRIITKPVRNSVKIWVDGKIGEVNIDYSSGIVGLNYIPEKGRVITADFEFDVPVRFDNDRLQAQIDNYGSYSWHEISLIEVKI